MTTNRIRNGSVVAKYEPSRWIWNEVTERFAALVFGEDLPESIGWAQDLVGDDPDVYEEFDTG
jgi:hypothetical protein